MLYNIANKNSSWQAVLRWPWFVFCLGVCRQVFASQRYLLSTTTYLITQNTFFARLPVGNRVGSSPSLQSEWNLRHSRFSSVWSKLHWVYLILRCITSAIRFCWVWKNVLFFCRVCEIMQTLLQSSSRSVALRACRVQIAHTSTVLLVGSLVETEQKRSLPHQHSQSTVPAIEWLPLFSLPLLIFFFSFFLQPWAVSDSPLFSSLLQLFSVTEHPASRPLTLFLVGSGGEKDKATSVGDTNMAQSQHQYYVCAPSFSASHRVIDPPPHPAPFSFPIQVCPLPALTLSKLLFWLK